MILEIKDLTKKFQTSKKSICALNDINFKLEKGTFLTVIGPSGCGKTTLLRCIAGLEKPESGKIIVDGKPADVPGINRMMVFQDFNQLFPWYTVIDNVKFPLKLIKNNRSKEEREEIAKYYLKLVGLEGYEHMYPYQLSGGMKQRVAIARALSVSPKILLMDEPFGSLDAFTRTSLQQELIRIWEQTGVTIIFVTHNIDEAINLSDKIMVIRCGKIVKMINNTLERPRECESHEFSLLWKELHGLLRDKNLNSHKKGRPEIKQEVEMVF